MKVQNDYSQTISTKVSMVYCLNLSTGITRKLRHCKELKIDTRELLKKNNLINTLGKETLRS